MSNPFETPGAISWMELMTTDPQAAKAFYSNVLGWEIQDGSINAEDSYDLFKPRGAQGPVGGIMKMPAECKSPMPVWGMYVTVEDVDATARQARQQGGTILKEPTDMPGVGRMAVLQDPQGAVFSVIRYEMKPED